MSNIKLLLDVDSDMRSLADSIETVANAITSSDSENVEITATKVKEAKPKKITLEEVRGVLAKKSQAGLTLK